MHEVIFAGFGGQGVLLAGKMLAYAGMMEGKEVSWIPAYGPEMRGGTAFCSTIIADEEIGSPIVTKPNALVVLNGPSLDRFESSVLPGGVLIINNSLIERKSTRTDIKVYYVPMNDIAIEFGNVRYLNMVALGALVEATGAIGNEAMEKIFIKQFGKHEGAVEANMRAAKRGEECIAAQRSKVAAGVR